MNEHRVARYEQRFKKVLDYVDNHLDGDLSLTTLSEQAAFSKFHFLRQFAALYGISVADYVQTMRLRRAAQSLAYRSDQSILTIALANGFDSAEAFSRAFKRLSGQTPTAFRRHPLWLTWHDKLQLIKDIHMSQVKPAIDFAQIKIIDFPATRVAILQHRDRPERLPQSIQRFIAWRKANKLPPTISATFNLVYDDPDVVVTDSFRFDLCAGIKQAVAPNDAGVIDGEIPAGRCAVWRHIGRDDGMATAIHFLYRDWLPQSGETLRDFPLFFHRLKFYPDVPETEVITDIYLPLER